MQSIDRRISQPRRRFQFTLRVLLVGIAVIACGLGWIERQLRSATQERAHIATLLNLPSGRVPARMYDATWVIDIARRGRITVRFGRRPDWLVRLAQWCSCDLCGPVSKAELEGTDITDEHLRRIAALVNLRSLRLIDTAVTDKGVEQLQRDLPRCKIHRGR